MRKVISLFLALSVLCFATSAMATPSAGNTTTSRSATTTFFNGTPTRASAMPGFRPGDTISFTVSNLTTSKELTVISYKCTDSNLTAAVTPSDSNVQYINQYTVSGTTQSITYTVRDQATGIYCLKMNDSGNGSVATFYYRVGKLSDVSVSLISKYGTGTPYTKVDYHDGTYSIGFIGKATINSTVVGVGDVGANVGFTFTDTSAAAKLNGVTKTVSGSTLDTYFNNLISNQNIQINGSYSVIYGMTIYNVPATDKDKITATAVVN